MISESNHSFIHSFSHAVAWSIAAAVGLCRCDWHSSRWTTILWMAWHRRAESSTSRCVCKLFRSRRHDPALFAVLMRWLRYVELCNFRSRELSPASVLLLVLLLCRHSTCRRSVYRNVLHVDTLSVFVSLRDRELWCVLLSTCRLLHRPSVMKLWFLRAKVRGNESSGYPLRGFCARHYV